MDARFLVLGLVSITDGRDVVVLRASKPTTLLAALLLHPDSVVSTEFLQQALWGEEPPATAKATLQTYVLRLRRLFAKFDIGKDAIETVPGGYRMSMSASMLDLVEFRELVARAGAQEDPEAELALVREALGLWQGPLLANIQSDVLHRDEVPRLTEEWLRAVERVFDIELALGRCRRILADLWKAARSHPGHERFWEQLIEALYRTGRQGEALAEYRRVKTFLQEELGVDPGPSLRRLEMAILRGDVLGTGTGEGDGEAGGAAPAPPGGAAVPAGAVEAAAAHGPAASAGPRGLPPAPPSFTGRAAETEALAARLAGGRPGPMTAVVSGPPGVGKTALALHLAHTVRPHFPDGQWTVRLTAPDGTPRPAAEALAELGPEAREALAGGDRRVLLLLDDAAHAEQVRPLLPSAPGSAALVTSRMSLSGLVAMEGGWVHRLGPLRPEESHALLAVILGEERAAAEPDAVAELAELCGHFPLALRIAAARLLMRPRLLVADGARWLGEDPLGRLALADDPSVSVVRILDQALQRLPGEVAGAFVRIGAAAAPRLTAGECARLLGLAPSATEDVLERLVDAGLLEEGQSGEYHMHALLRRYTRVTTARGGLRGLDGESPGDRGDRGAARPEPVDTGPVHTGPAVTGPVDKDPVRTGPVGAGPAGVGRADRDGAASGSVRPGSLAR